MSDYHEPVRDLSSRTRDFTRALITLKEEIEAIDWYHQRVDASDDESLIDIMRHNMHEEMEHACMALEWLRRNMEGWDEKMKTYLFTDEPVTEIEEEKSGDRKGENDDGSIGLVEK